MKYNTVTVREICNYITSGGTPSSTIENYYVPAQIPWLKTKEVNYSRIYETENYISRDGLEHSSAKLIPENSVIVAMYGQGDTAGRVAINKIPLTTNQACCNLVIDAKKADYNYIYYALSGMYEKLVSLKNGGAQPNLNAKIIGNIKIELPDITVQRRIADILSAYDDLIENNRKQIKLLEEAAQRLYKEWFVDLRFPGWETTEVVDGVPVGWKKRRVQDFGTVITGKTPSTAKNEYYGDSIPFVTIPDMHNSVFPLKTEKSLSIEGANTQEEKYIPTNSVLVSCIATVGLVNITSCCCQTNQQINSVILDREQDLYFFYLSMKQIKSLLDGIGSNGATMTNVNKTKFSRIEILYPSKDLSNQFYKVCVSIFDKILILEKEILVLEQARDLLLPKLMSGKLEV